MFASKAVAQRIRPEVMLVEDLTARSGSNLGARLSAMGVSVLENYGSFALASITPEETQRLQREGLEVTALPNRTRTGRGSIQFDTRKGDPVVPIELQSDHVGGPTGHYIVQFIGPVKQQWLRDLEAQGVELFDYLPFNSFVVAMPPRTVKNVREAAYVQWVGGYHAGYKVVPGLIEPSVGTRPVLVFLFPQEDPSRVKNLLASWGAAVSAERREAEGTGLRTSLSAAYILELARLPEVSWIEEDASSPTLSNADATWVLQSNVGTPSPNRSIHDHGIRGQGQIVTFAEGAADTTHPSLTNKVQQQIIAGCGTDTSPDWHATAVASVIAGNYGGVDTYDCWDGHALGASLINVFMGRLGNCFSITDFYNLVYGPSYSAGARVHAEGPDEQANYCLAGYQYRDRARQADLFVWDHKDFVITMPAGNEGVADENGVQTRSEFIRIGAMAKDIITVGATWNGSNANKMAGYSSPGPACDGRRKPTVVAPGGDSLDGSGTSPVKTATTTASTFTVCGADQNNKYSGVGGTSFAHPAVAASASLVRQYFTEGWYPTGTKTPSNAITPSAALVKATLINSAAKMTDDSAFEASCPDCYPNNVQGWGRVLLDNALYFSGDSRKLTVIDESLGLANTGDVKDYWILVTSSDPANSLKVTLVWSDYPGANNLPLDAPALVNNLDLVVTSPDCTVYRGNGVQSGDSVNVEEQVEIPATPMGLLKVSVRAAAVPQPSQPYALVITGNVGGVASTPPAGTAACERMLTGTINSGSFMLTMVSDDVYEVLQEATQGGDALSHVWEFDNVPAQTNLTLQLEGNRVSSSDGDNFVFYWSDTLNGTYTSIPNAGIKLPFERQGGAAYPFTRSGTSATIFIKVTDTNPSGSHADSVNVDYLQIY